MKLIFFLLPLIYLSGNAYLYWKVMQTVSGAQLWLKSAISILFWISAFSMFVSIALKDEIAELPSGIQIIGRDDRSNTNRQPLDILMARADSARPVVVLDHQPFNLAEADAAGVDLQVSGHTHNGQIWPLNMLVGWIFEQGHGYRKWSHAHIYVSSGLSLWGPPFRIGTKSDLAVMRIRGEG